MADNVQVGTPVGDGVIFACAELTVSGDTAKVQMISPGALTGSEGSWTYTLFVGGAGVVGAGVQRMTLASDDPAVTALQVLDDWDESDRAKVNPIVGQAGIAAGAGAVGATVPRVTLASDDPAVAHLANVVTAVQLIDNAISGAGFNITQLGGAAVPIGAGTEAAAVRVTLATDSTGVVSIDDNGGAITVDGTVTANATLAAETTKVIGTINIAAAQTLATVTTVGAVTAISNALPAGTNLLGKVGIDQVTANANEVVTKAGSVTTATLADETTKVIGTVNIAAAQTIAAVTAISNALPAGDNNIGNVDIVSLPAGNVGMQAMAASLSVVPASDITDATYVGDIKFGESLPAGTNAIGKLAANSGVDIGDVDVTSIAAGTNTIGGVIAQHGNTAYDATTACTIKNVMVVTNTDGATLIAAVAAKKFRILAMSVLSASATVTNFWLEDADGADVYGDSTGLPVQTTGVSGPAGVVLNFNPGGWFTTATANKNLVIKLTAAQKVVVTLTYIEVA